MGIYIFAIIYCLCLVAAIIALQTKLLRSENDNIRAAAWIVSGLFVGYWMVLLVGILRDKNRDASIMGWFVFAYFLVISLTIYAAMSLIVYFIDRRFS